MNLILQKKTLGFDFGRIVRRKNGNYFNITGHQQNKRGLFELQRQKKTEVTALVGRRHCGGSFFSRLHPYSHGGVKRWSLVFLGVSWGPTLTVDFSDSGSGFQGNRIQFQLLSALLSLDSARNKKCNKKIIILSPSNVVLVATLAEWLPCNTQTQHTNSNSNTGTVESMLKSGVIISIYLNIAIDMACNYSVMSFSAKFFFFTSTTKMLLKHT